MFQPSGLVSGDLALGGVSHHTDGREGPVADSRWVTVESQLQNIFAFSAGKAGHPHPALLCPHLHPHTKYRAWHLFHWIWSCSSQTHSSSLLCPGCVSSQLPPHPAVPSIYKRKLPSQSPEKQEMTVQREVLSRSSVLPNDSEEQRPRKQGRLCSLTCPLLQQLGCRVGRCLGRVFCYLLQWICRKTEEKRNKDFWHSSPHDKDNLMTGFPDSDSSSNSLDRQ